MQDNEPINITYGQLSDMINRIEQIPSLSGKGAPTSATPAFHLGQTYIDTTTGKSYYCSGIEEESGDESGAYPTFIWQEGGKTYVAGQNIQINGNEISATDTTYTAGDGINISAQDVISTTNTGKARVLTTADYNYPTDNPTSVALWLMDPGIYINSNSVNVKMHLQDGSNSPCLYFVAPTMSSTSKIIIKTGNENGGAEQAFNKFTVRTDTGAKSNYVLVAKPNNSLTSTSDNESLSALQGKVLNERIGDLTTLQTTAKTSAVAAINELKTTIGNIQETEPTSGSTPTASTEGTIGQTYVDNTTGDVYILTSIVEESGQPDSYVWTPITIQPGTQVEPLTDNELNTLWENA